MTENIFFAVFPEREAALEIENRARQLQRTHGFRGKLIEAERLHITLIGFNLYVADQEKLVGVAERAIAKMATRPFCVSLENTGSFKGRDGHHPFVLLSDHKSQAALAALRRDLSLTLRKSVPGMKFASAGFTPHVTLLYAHRTVDDDYPLKYVIRWTVKEFALVRSLVGESIYIPLRKWRLGV